MLSLCWPIAPSGFLWQVGAFDADNRSGIDQTLHRISAIRNRAGRVVGLTCRVGRVIEGSAAMVEDFVRRGRNILLLGRSVSITPAGSSPPLFLPARGALRHTISQVPFVLSCRDMVVPLMPCRPGVGKTTAIRDISCMLANSMHKRTVIVDTSNEIGGDGDVPHPGIGDARRMQVINVINAQPAGMGQEGAAAIGPFSQGRGL